MPPTMYTEGHLGGYVPGGDPSTWCPHLWTWVVREFKVQSVLDVGCGEGHSTRFFSKLGCEARGVEGCEKAVRESVAPGRVSLHDFRHGSFQTAPYDLAWSCEFLEHIDESYLEHVLQTLSLARKLILVTHAFPGQRGHHHVNCQPNHYWIRRIEALGFECVVDTTLRARTETFKDYHSINHFARSGLVFVRRSSPWTSPSLWTAWSSRMKGARLKAFRYSRAYREQRRHRHERKRLAA